MPYILSQFKVKDFNTWYSGFSSAEGVAMRNETGAQSYQVFQTEDDPNNVIILLKWDSLDNARKFFQSDKLKEATKDSGVLGPPEMFFLKEAGKG
jgi:heme-degrading monooxygenase HmoA